jgi:vancomycin resistance protein YoaR
VKQPTQTEPSASATTTGPRRWLRVAVVGVAGVLFAAAGAVTALALVRQDETLPGVTIADRAAGGLGDADLRALVDDLESERAQATVTVVTPDGEAVFSPGPQGYTADVEATVEAAMAAGRDGIVDLVTSQVSATFGDHFPVELVDSVDDTVVDAFVSELRTEIDRDMNPGEVTVDPATLEVSSTLPVDARDLDVDALRDSLVALVGEPQAPEVEAPVEITPAPTDESDVEAAAATAREAVSAPLALTSGDATATLTPQEIAAMLRSDVRDGRITLSADADVLAQALADDLPELERAPVEASFEVAEGLRTFDTKGATSFDPSPAQLTVVPSRPGARFEPEPAAEQVSALIEAGAHDGPLELVEVEADLTTSEAEALRIDTLLGTFTTYHACCANRVHNIQLLADLVRGTILEPGEDFSINRDIGERTRAKGFLADGAIVNGEIKDEVGGGISQFATTMFNAAFFAGIDVEDWRAHSLYISRYPLGREATLDYGNIDLKIRNDTDHGLYLHTSYTSTSITVSIFGHDDGREVTATLGSPYGWTNYETRRENDPGLPQGTENVKQTGKAGYSVNFSRIIDWPDRQEVDDYTTVYRPRPEIVEVGTAPPPPPPPADPPADAGA